MTVLDSFLSFARNLPAERLESIEAALAAMMDTYTDATGFSGVELFELDRRLAEPKPLYAAQSEIDTLLGRKKQA